MKKNAKLWILVMLLFFSVLFTGCSYRVTSSVSRIFQGESEHWSGEYVAEQRAEIFEKAGENCATRTEMDHLLVTWKEDAPPQKPETHFELKCDHIFGGTSTRIEDTDEPVIKKEFRGGTQHHSSTELYGKLKEKANLGEAIKIYCYPTNIAYADASGTVTLTIGDKTETMILKPVGDALPTTISRAGLGAELKQLQFKIRYPELAKEREQHGLR